MKTLTHIASYLALAGMIAAGVILTGVFFLIITEVVLRAAFGASTHIVEEVVGYGVAWSTFLALGYAFEAGAIVRVDLLLQVSNRFYNKCLEAGCIISALTCMAMLQYSLIGQIRRDYVRGYTSGTIIDIPSYFPKTIIVAGLAIFMVVLVAHAANVFLDKTRRPQDLHQSNRESAF